jgi:hypothetical protein
MAVLFRSLRSTVFGAVPHWCLVQMRFTPPWSGLSQGKLLSHQVVEGLAVSVLNGQRWETKLHSTKADGVPSSLG